ncbi:MAG: ferredoxin [Candidatus Dormibacteraeota bacterium]|nr:ferredoxin [Candidatus Dormibacteraeota bacterium]MBV8446077.1 ferredoxin [Candidatus Dormibacteraeota bacterium]
MKRRLRVDPIACKAHGVCAELFPERIRLDDWGYPVLDDRPLPDELVEHARRAVDACPRTALHLVPIDERGARGRPELPAGDEQLLP